MPPTEIHSDYRRYSAEDADALQWYLDSDWQSAAPMDDSLWIDRHLAENPIRSVLDVGCGSGRLFPVWSRHGLDAVGVDFSAQLLPLRISTVEGRMFNDQNTTPEQAKDYKHGFTL